MTFEKADNESDKKIADRKSGGGKIRLRGDHHGKKAYPKRPPKAGRSITSKSSQARVEQI